MRVLHECSILNSKTKTTRIRILKCKTARSYGARESGRNVVGSFSADISRFADVATSTSFPQNYTDPNWHSQIECIKSFISGPD